MFTRTLIALSDWFFRCCVEISFISNVLLIISRKECMNQIYYISTLYSILLDSHHEPSQSRTGMTVTRYKHTESDVARGHGVSRDDRFTNLKSDIKLQLKGIALSVLIYIIGYNTCVRYTIMMFWYYSTRCFYFLLLQTAMILSFPMYPDLSLS